MDQLAASESSPATDWLWAGYLARGNLTLLTSLWKAGKTTLLSGLLRQLGSESTFLDRPCGPARAVVVSEESRAHWAERLRVMPVGPHARLIARPFVTRPTADDWDALIDEQVAAAVRGDLDLFVVDPLATVLGRGEGDAGTVLEVLRPLRRLADAGVAVLLLHHPRKRPADEGSSARGSGALLAAVDVILELHRLGPLASDVRRRRLIGLSRHAETPSTLTYEWDSETGAFTVVADAIDQRFLDNWEQVRHILSSRRAAATHHELLADWPSDRPRPSPSILYDWLNRAHAARLVRRQGTGRRDDPYRYRLPNADDAFWDRGELPPLRPLFER